MSGRRLHGEDGAALVLALAFVTIVSIGVTALLTLADTGQRTTGAIRDQGYEVYSANGAVDRAITAVRSDLSLGRQAGPCPDVTTNLNGVATTVECQGAVGSGVGGGGGANANNSPANALLTLAGSGGENGLVQESNNVMKITGPVVSNSNVRVNVASASLVVDGPVKARDTCSAQVVSVPARQCDLGSSVIAHSGDPGYAMHPDAPAGSPPALAPAPQGCVPGSRTLVKLFPGTYRSVSQLNTLFSSCTGSVFWFEPGFYYFDFTDSAARWEITGSNTRVVGGVRTRWSPAAPAPGDPAPTVPFPADADPVTGTSAVLGGCVTSDEQPTTPGIQFAFGGTSRLFVQDAKVELCARGSTNQQQIAVYGLPPAQDTTVPAPPAPAQQTVTLTSPGPAGTSGNPTFDHPDNARQAGAGVATATGTQGGSGSTAVLTLPALQGPAIPAGSTVDSLTLHVVHQPVNGNVTGLGAQLLRSDGTPFATFADTQGGNCGSATTTAICFAPTTTPYDQRVRLAGPFSLADLSGASLRFTAGVKTGGNVGAGQERVDLLEVDVAYTPPTPVPPTPYRRLSGCHASSLEAGGCPLLQTVGGPTAVAVHGTFYAPSGALRLELTNLGSSVLRRGVVARTARVAVTSSSSFLGSPIALPPLGGSPSNREVVFVARQGARVVLRAVVRFDDTGSLTPDRRADVTSWSVLR